MTRAALRRAAGLHRRRRWRCSMPAPTSIRSRRATTRRRSSSPSVNGHFDLGAKLLERGRQPEHRQRQRRGAALRRAQPEVGAGGGVSAAVGAARSADRRYLEFMKLLLDKGADPNARLTKKVWYSGYNFDLSGIDEVGATPFWRAAYGADVEAMKLLVAHGADPNIPTSKPPGRPRTGDADIRQLEDVSGMPPIPTGGPGMSAAARGVGRRLRRRLCRQLAPLRAERPAAGGEVSRRGAGRGRQRRAITRATRRCISRRRVATTR